MAYLGHYHIVFDLDDVLADFWKTVLPEMNAYFNTNVKKEQFTDYTRFGDLFGLTGFNEFSDFLVENKLLEQLTPHQHMINMLNFAYGYGAEVSIVTSRGFHPNALEITKKWLDERDVSYSNLMIAGRDGLKKSDVVNNIDVVYDDHHAHLEDYIDSGVMKGDGRLYLVDQPWNRHFDHKLVQRVSHDKIKEEGNKW